jgi:hypothetical protein
MGTMSKFWNWFHGLESGDVRGKATEHPFLTCGGLALGSVEKCSLCQAYRTFELSERSVMGRMRRWIL